LLDSLRLLVLTPVPSWKGPVMLIVGVVALLFCVVLGQFFDPVTQPKRPNPRKR
jgi:hypothetical protein